jgi:integrase
MRIVIICPKCKGANSIKAVSCSGKIRYGEKKGENCSVNNLKRLPDKVYAVDYRVNGKRKRETIGSSKILAERRLLEIEESINRGGNPIEDDMTLHDLFDWNLELPETKAKLAYRRVTAQTKALRRILDSNGKVSDLTIRQLEYYVSKRGKEDSLQQKGQKVAPKTIKEELNLLRSILNKAIDHGVISSLPVRPRLYPKITVDNVREKIFTEDEMERILEASPLWLKRIIIMAKGTGMRQDEIIQLKWDSVDLRRGFVRLKAKETKTKKARSVKLSREILDMLLEIPRDASSKKVFISSTGRPLPYWTTYCHDTWRKVLDIAGVEDACFHDLRHYFITMAMRRGNRKEVVMKQVGHETDAALRRYNCVNETDLAELLF